MSGRGTMVGRLRLNALQITAALLFLSVVADKVHALQITVQPESGAPLILDVEAGDTILNVKKKIELQNGVPPAQQVLKFGAITLEDHPTLSDYNIQKSDILDLSVLPASVGGPGSNSAAVEGATSVAHLLGSSVQANFNTSTFHFQFLKRQVARIAAGRAETSFSFSDQSLLSRDAPLSSFHFSDQPAVQLASYQESTAVGATDFFDDPSPTHESCRTCSEPNRTHGWVQSYVIGGDANSRGGVAGYDYSALGTQLGVAREVDSQTLLGVYGNYGYQALDTFTDSQSIINGGQLGGFLYRADHLGNDYLLAANVGVNEHSTLRTGNVRGEFSGGQSGVFFDRGWTRSWRGAKLRPSIALQHLWVHHNAFTETGVGGVSVDSVDEHSLRSIIGLDTVMPARNRSFLGFCLQPTAHAHWVHEYLDSATTITGIAGGNQFAITGLDAGNDWAFMGVGLNANRGDAVTIQAGYDAQFATYVQLHTASVAIVLTR